MRCDDRMGLEICRGGKISAAAENSGFVKMSTALALFWFLSVALQRYLGTARCCGDRFLLSA